MVYKRPKVPNKPTLPFTREEMIGILTALGSYCKSAGLRNAQRLMAFILLLYYSGLRIGDAVQLNVNRLQANKLLLHTEKTGVHVYCVLPNSVRVGLTISSKGDKTVYGQFRLYVTQLERAVPSFPLILRRWDGELLTRIYFWSVCAGVSVGAADLAAVTTWWIALVTSSGWSRWIQCPLSLITSCRPRKESCASSRCQAAYGAV